MVLETENVLNEINNAAPVVAEQHGEHLAALAEEAAAGAALLKAVIEKVRPALPALGSRVKVAYYCDVEGPRNDSTYADWQGLYINKDGMTVGPVSEGMSRDNNRGPCTGIDYFLVTRHPDKSQVGRFAEVDYSGSWSRWQREADQWNSDVKFLPVCEVLKEVPLSIVLSEISAALTAQLAGKKPERTKQAWARAEQLKALVVLLGGGVTP